MNKTAIKNFAIWARVNLIEAVKQRAYEYEITKDGANNASLESVGGRILSRAECDQRRALINEISEKGFDQVMEEAAYTWFNRFIALRFMEVNGYLPARVRVFTNEEGEFKPEIMKEAMTVEIDGLKRDIVLDLIDKQNNEELYKYLLITQCNALGNGLPKMFEKIEHWTELLFPANLLRADGVIGRMVTDIPEEDFADIEIIGWMYQYYITEPHERIVNPLHSRMYTKEEVPAATQIFTTEWVVRYIVDNSLGRYWIERHPDSELKNKLQYLVVPKSGIFDVVNESIKPEDLTVMDPCVGSGHFLAYAFEVLMMIYTECGWSERDAAKSIVERNLYGLDIDERAGQLAYFTIMMKGRKYNRRALSEGASGFQPNIYAIAESNNISRFAVEDFCNGDIKALAEMDKLIRVMKDAKEYGSILNIKDIDFDILLNTCDASLERITLHNNEIKDDIIPLIKMAYVMAQKYNIVVTNPPYMNKFSPKLKDFINANYAAYKGDLFSVFIYKCFGYCKANGYSGLMTPNVWLFIKTYEELRKYIVNNKAIITLALLEKSSFTEASVSVCPFVLKNVNSLIEGTYIKLDDFKGNMDVQDEKTKIAIKDVSCVYRYERCTNDFSLMPGYQIAFWLSSKVLNVISKAKMSDFAEARIGLVPGNNDRYIRFWHEVDFKTIGFQMNREEAKQSQLTWFPYDKGGAFRKWYGNMNNVIDWYRDGNVMQTTKHPNGNRIWAHNFNLDYIFKPHISCSDISGDTLCFRYFSQGFLFDSVSTSIFTDSKRTKYILGLINSVVIQYIANAINPTIHFKPGDFASLPCLIQPEHDNIDAIVDNLINESKEEYDSFETSWDFKKHPLV